MKTTLFLLLLAAWSAWAQAGQTAPAKPAETGPDAVVVTIEGKKFTEADLQAYVKVLPPQGQQIFASNRKEFVKQLARLIHLSQLAEEQKLNQQSPYREQLELNRMTMLMQFAVNDKHQHLVVTDEERKTFYEAHEKDRFTQAKLKVIYVAFNADPNAQPDSKGKKPLTEAEAKTRAEEVLSKVKAGGDFVKLVKDYSDDPISASENGDFGPVKRTDNIDPTIKNAIFALKPGELSDPVRQPNGFYVFRLEELISQPYDQVKNEIFKEMQNEKLQQWMTDTDKALQIKYDNEAFFAQPAAAGPPVPPALPPAVPPSLRKPVK